LGRKKPWENPAKSRSEAMNHGKIMGKLNPPKSWENG
jgi:hypothetical protein